MEKQLKKVLNIEYSDDKLIDFEIKTRKIYDLFDYNFKINQIKINTQTFYGGKIWLNEYYEKSAISDLEIISFDIVYPKLISKIAHTNLENFNEVYSKLIKIYTNKNDISICKYINMAYGCLQNQKSSIYSNNIYLVSIYLNQMLLKISNEFKDHIIYIDTDQIFFRNFEEIKERFEKYLISINKYDLTYYITKSKFGYFSNIKKYLIEENGYIKIKGLSNFNIDGKSKGGYIKLN